VLVVSWSGQNFESVGTEVVVVVQTLIGHENYSDFEIYRRETLPTIPNFKVAFRLTKGLQSYKKEGRFMY